tara:strand:- start:1507 stop:1815 length:309 start_codon:yes stop_codon:yes gene_type:complete
MIFAVDALAHFENAHLAKGLNPDRLHSHHQLLCSDLLRGKVWRKAIITGDIKTVENVANEYCQLIKDLTQRSEEIINQIWETQPTHQDHINFWADLVKKDKQ